MQERDTTWKGDRVQWACYGWKLNFHAGNLTKE